MENFDWKLTIRINILMLQSVGLWPRDNEMYKPNLYTIYAIICTVVLVGGHNLFQLMNIFFVYKDLEALAQTIFISATDLLASVKIGWYVVDYHRCHKYGHFNCCFDDVAPLSSASFSHMFYVTAIIAQILLYCWFGNEVELRFAGYRINFVPVNFDGTQENINFRYQLGILTTAISIWIVIIAVVNMDMFLVALVAYLCAQCNILCDTLRNLKDSRSLDFNRKLIESIKHHKEILRDYEFPLPAWYPYNTKQSPIYEITYAYQAVSTWILVSTDVNIDMFLAALMMYVGAQCNILCDNLRNLKNCYTENGWFDFNDNLIGCIKHHKEILR
ncbi:7tm 6 domain containing protein [Asbolus verrucosus]|uniref:7tm 6 domain containing protein n=1 Tax=Asbolus verrucosus TaxID=1661398 RepID=A0A482VPD2_ASBVE|nr:7tm 6 domain containing protein [Asbolus verrucosus]